jgi:hypothetical protein
MSDTSPDNADGDAPRRNCPHRPVGCCERLEVAHLGQKPPGAGDGGPCFRRPDRSARTGDEHGTDLTFESVNSLCDRRRSQIEPTRRFSDRAVLDRHEKALQEARIH